MPKSSFEPCIPTRGTKVPDRPEWLHEIKHDGYRLIIQRDGSRMRLFTRNGHDWSERYPVDHGGRAAKPEHFFRDRWRGRVARCRRRSDFNGLHSRRHDAEVEFYAFDILVRDGEDVRKLPLSMRKANLERLLARRVDGIFLSLRAGRDRPRPVPPRLPDGAGGHGFEASRPPLSRRPIAELDQGEEPSASGVQQGSGSRSETAPALAHATL